MIISAFDYRTGNTFVSREEPSILNKIRLVKGRRAVRQVQASPAGSHPSGLAGGSYQRVTFRRHDPFPLVVDASMKHRGGGDRDPGYVGGDDPMQAIEENSEALATRQATDRGPDSHRGTHYVPASDQAPLLSARVGDRREP